MISIRHKLVLSHTSVMLFTALIAIVILGYLQLENINRIQDERASSMATAFAKDYAELLYRGRNDKAIDFTLQLKGIPDIRFLYLYRQDGTQVFSYQTSETDTEPGQDLQTNEYLKPVIFADRQLGSIKLGISTEQTREAYSSFIEVIVVLTVAILLLALLLSFWIQRLMSGPVLELTRLTREITQSGDYSRRMSVKSHDEVGSLYQNFNHLLDAAEKAEAELIQEKERVQTTLESLAEGVISTDVMGMIQYLNPAAEQTLDTRLDSVKGQSINSVLSIFPGNGQSNPRDPVDKAIAQNQVIVEEDHSLMICEKTGKELEIDYSAAPIRSRNQDVVGAVFIFRDVSKTRELARKLSEHSQLDLLTGFYNRGHFEILVDDALTEAKATGQAHALFYVDLDRFKSINEAHGFVAGDGLIRSLAEMLRDILGDEIIPARLGGDEFGILVKSCSTDRTQKIADDIVGYIGTYPYIWDQTELSVKASVGIVAINAESTNALQLVANAGMACMAAKEKGGGRAHFYQPDDISMARRISDLRWVEKLKVALLEDQFVLYYQPMVPMAHNEAAYPFYEILIRYQNSAGKLVSPAKFLPAAEKQGLMPEIDRWVIEHLLTACGSSSPGFGAVFNKNKEFLVSINISGQSMEDDSFQQFIRDQFTSHQVDPKKFCFEITETAAISNLSKAHKFIQQMRKIGCKFALDDFGSGMSSFAYLKNLPVDYLKIDGSFVRDIASVPADFELVKAVHQIGNALDMRTIAEFVEDENTATMLQEIGVDYGQGFFFAIPSPISIAPEIYCEKKSGNG